MHPLHAYPVLAVAALAAVVGLEWRVLRTGLFRLRAYWMSMAIVLGFQVLVDGWMSKLSAPIVRYNPHHISGLRFPWDIPTEEFIYGFALVTLVLALWERAGKPSGVGTIESR